MIDFHKYVLPDQEYSLDVVDYHRIDGESNGNTDPDFVLSDSISADIIDNKQLKINFQRRLFCEPEGVFSLHVSFTTIFTLDPETKDEVDWSKVNIAEEIVNYGEGLLTNIVSRTSLLISQITSSFGQLPIMTPPTLAKSDN